MLISLEYADGEDILMEHFWLLINKLSFELFSIWKCVWSLKKKEKENKKKKKK